VRRSSRLAVPLLRPEDVIPHLGKPTHWKQGRSAKALADAWFRAGDIPHAVKRVLASSPFWLRADLLEAWLERETDLQDGRVTPSQTDLLALVGVDKQLGVLGIEAKVDESFGPLVSKWSKDLSSGKEHRLTKLCALFGLEPSGVGHFRYQLLHRAAAAIYEAQRFRCDSAALIIHSFSPSSVGIDDCRIFSDAIGLKGLKPDTLIGARRFAGVDFWIGWAQDVPWEAETATAALHERVAQ
jgi:hypothetical protein